MGNIEKFMSDFESALTEIIATEGSRAHTIDEERMQQLSDIFMEMTDFIDEDDLEVDFIPEFASGAVMMEVQELRTVGDEVQKLKMILDKADNFTIVPLLDGGVRISFTVQNVFK